MACHYRCRKTILIFSTDNSKHACIRREIIFRRPKFTRKSEPKITQDYFPDTPWRIYLLESYKVIERGDKYLHNIVFRYFKRIERT